MDLIKLCFVLTSVALSIASLIVSRQAVRYARQAEIVVKRNNPDEVD